MFLENKRDERFKRLSILMREIKREFAKGDSEESIELMKMLIEPSIEKLETVSLSVEEMQIRILSEGLISYIPSIREGDFTTSRIVIYLNISSLMPENKKMLHGINIDVIVPTSHWDTPDGPKPLLMVNLMDIIIRNFKYQFTGLGGLEIGSIVPLIVSEKELGYTISLQVGDFS